MKYRQYLISSFNVLNLSLLVAACVFFFYFLNPLLSASLSVNVPSPKEISQGMPVSADEATKPSASDYAVIGEQNLFHPNRVITTEKKADPVVPKSELVLYGTLISNGLKIAFLQDKKEAPTTPGRGARQIAVKEGDIVGGYTLKQITEKMIFLINGEEQMTLYLDELKNRTVEMTGTGRTQATAQTIQPAQRTPAASPTAPMPAPPPGGFSAQPASPAPVAQPRTPSVMQPFPPIPVTPMPSLPVMKRP
ncbi:MAG: hypothetical protein NTY16_06625 [Deltaproteobacteria bacterium]|nr:hypothetical protein [Deltaproteobacteria bacterium]